MVDKYTDEERLERFKQIWLTERCKKLLAREKKRLSVEEKRELSEQKIINNLILKEYGKN